MNRRNRIFLGILGLFALGVGVLLFRVAADFDTRYRESAEESLADTAYLLAAFVETDMHEQQIDPARLRAAMHDVYGKHFEAHIYGITKRQVDLRVYVTDAGGIVVFDSLEKSEGQDFSGWRDITHALAGEYGARTTRNVPDKPETAIMYVAAPIHSHGSIVGAVSIGKPVASQQELVHTARQKLLYVGLITLGAFFALLVVFSVWISRPFGLTADLVRLMRQEGLRHPWRTTRRVAVVIRAAFDDMRDVLAGHNHTEEYVQTFTHELKSPLTAIRGAAELLREPMPDAQRERFVSNIGEQVKRLQNLSDRLLELANLQSRRTLEEIRPVDVSSLIAEAVSALEPAASLKKIDLRIGVMEPVRLEGDRFLLCQALMNFLSNAIDFSPSDSEIEVSVRTSGKHVEMTVRDRGPGVPDFAAGRVFEKFYSLRRPDSGRKSTGLGLVFVREIAHLHGGKAYIANDPRGGAVAVLRLPSVPV